MDSDTPIGVLLLAFGGPTDLDEVEPFLKNLLGKSKIPSRQLEIIKSRYQQIGGGSPLLSITIRQAVALEERLKDSGQNFRVYAAMRYWYPSIEEVLKKMHGDGICRAVALSLTPHSSYITTNSYVKELKRVASLLNHNVHILTVEDWYGHPLFLEAHREKIEEGIKHFPEEQRADLPVVFSAHSLPQKLAFNGSSYQQKIEFTIKGIVERTGPLFWQLAFQSRGRGGDKWLEPDIEDTINDLSRKGHKRVMVSPISFVSDHLETLYDLDISLNDFAGARNMSYYRSSCLNYSPTFIQALARLVLERIEKDEKR